MSKRLVYRHFIGLVKDSDEISLEFDNGTISAYLETRAKSWSGPQDGLPKAGDELEYFTDGKGEAWCAAVVTYVGSHMIIVQYDHPADGRQESCMCHVTPGIETRLRQARTPEQLAAEQRETAIREFMDIVGIDCRVTAGKAVDAGFKREVV
jgi:hypothetical protein